MGISPFVKLKFGPPTIVCWSRSDSFWIALMEISLMAILFSSSDDCRWPKFQFNKQGKNVFCKPWIFTFCKFCVFATFCYFLFFDDFSIYIFILFCFWRFFDYPFFRQKSIVDCQQKLDNKKMIKKNDQNIENNIIFLFFIIILPFCNNNLQKCFKNPFLD